MKLGDLGEIFDGPHATPSRKNSGPYFLNIASLDRGRLNLELSDHISSEDFAKWTRRVIPRVGDLLFSYETRLGEAALMREDISACLGRRMALLRPNRAIVDPQYLLYHYLSPRFQSHIESRTIHGATVNRIALSTMADWSVDIPRLPEQRSIAEVLGALDDKIASNTDLARTADDLADAHFSTALVAQTFAPLTHLARFVNGKAFTKGATGTGRVVIRIAELKSGLGGSTVYNDLDVTDDHLAHPGDLLFAWSGSLTLHRWYRDEGIINQHIFKVIPRNGTPLWVIQQALRRKMPEFQAVAADKATTMGHIQRRHLEEPVDVPNRAELERIDPLMTSLWQRSLAAEMESLTLAVLRDTLLPQLMSGKLRVKDAGRQVEAVL